MSIYRNITIDTTIINNFLTAKQSRFKTEKIIKNSKEENKK